MTLYKMVRQIQYDFLKIFFLTLLLLKFNFILLLKLF
jgi:hypothetical protein